MKFLCVPCNSPMKLQTVGPPEGGSLSVVFSCPECGYEMAMLTNPYETQLVQSLGVRIGPGVGAASVPSTSAEVAVSDGASGRCPFPSSALGAGPTMVPATEGAPAGAGRSVSSGTEAAAPLRWTAGAEARLANIPEFVRPMAKNGIERFARERGAVEVNEEILDAARDFFGM